MKCPRCNHNIPDKTIAKHLAAKGGRAGAGTPERSKAASEAARARWAKYRENKTK